MFSRADADSRTALIVRFTDRTGLLRDVSSFTSENDPQSFRVLADQTTNCTFFFEELMDAIACRAVCDVIRWLVLRAAICGLLLGVAPPVGYAASAAASCGPHVEILRGLGGYMPGVRRLQKRLAACGISSTTTCSECSFRVSRRIIARRARGNCSPVVLLGYATGGGGTKRVADDLAEQGIAVDAVLLIDPSFFEPVPRNVRYCFVAYNPKWCQSWNPIMRGLPVRTESCRTAVRLINLKEHDRYGKLKGHSHLTITTSEWVQQILVCQAVQVFGLRSGRQCISAPLPSPVELAGSDDCETHVETCDAVLQVGLGPGSAADSPGVPRIELLEIEAPPQSASSGTYSADCDTLPFVNGDR